MLHNFILSIDVYVQKRYKKPFWTIGDGPVAGLVSPVSLLYFLAEFPSGAWRLAMYTYLPWLLDPREREPKVGHPLLFKRTPVA